MISSSSSSSINIPHVGWRMGPGTAALELGFDSIGI